MSTTKSFPQFIEKLGARLKKPLPGEMAHQVMEALSASWLDSEPSESTRRSAVLILLYPHENEIYFPLILRSSYHGLHSGQMAFAGGKYEQPDGDLICTALREAQEEIGIDPAGVKILGVLTEIFIFPSDFLVLPVIGYSTSRPTFLPNEREVEAIFETPLSYFSKPGIVGCSEIQIPNELVLTPHYEIEGHKVWGATAKMVHELLLILGE